MGYSVATFAASVGSRSPFILEEEESTMFVRSMQGKNVPEESIDAMVEIYSDGSSEMMTSKEPKHGWQREM